MNFNKKGFFTGTILASASLIAIVLVISVVSMILFNFNEEIQNQDSNVVGLEAKQAAAYSEQKFGGILGYGFMALFTGFLLFTIVTSVIINHINPIFWIVGFVIVIISTLISTVLKLVFGVLESVAVLAPYIAGIPGATWYFHNLEVFNVIWMGIQLTILYFTWER